MCIFANPIVVFMEKREVIVPERGSELYQGLLKIFKGKRDLFSSIALSPFEVIKDEELLDWGLSDAAGYLPDYIKMGESYLDDTNAHPPIGLGEYFLMWVLLKMQPDCGSLEKDRAKSIYDDIERQKLMYGENRYLLFDGCVKLVNRLTDPQKAFEEASEALKWAINSTKTAENKIRDLKGSVKLGCEKIEKQRRQIVDLENRCKELEHVKTELQEKIVSKDFFNKLGQEYLRRVFEEFLKESDEMEQSLRRDWFNVLQGFCSIEGVPKEVKKMIQSLKKKSQSSSGTTVIAQNGSTVNNNDIHDNSTVNTK